MNCSLPDSSVHGILQARILEWVAISFSRGSSRPRDWTQVSLIVGRLFTNWATREHQKKKKKKKKKNPPIKKTTKNRGELLNHKRPDSLIQWIVGGTCKFAFVPGSQVILMLLDLWTREQLN